MTQYIDVPIETDADDLAQLTFDGLQETIPGYVPAAGNLDTILTEKVALQASVIANLAAAMPVAAFRFFGRLVSILPIDATPATATTTWTMVDNAGYTILAGTRVGVRAAGDLLVPFEVVNDIVVTPGTTATSAGAVLIRAITAGAAASGLGTIGGPVELIDILDYVDAITLAAATTGGVDAETDAVYDDRLAARLQLLSDGLVLPDDFAVYAQNVAGVDRALAIDLYNPADGTYTNERTVTVAVIDANGNAVSGGTKTAVDALLQSKREVNFVVHVIDPQITSIDVTFSFTTFDSYLPADVETRAEAAVSDYLNGANWGRPPAGDPREWIDDDTVSYLEVATVINNVAGVNKITALTLGISGGALSAADVTLAGPASLPDAGTIAGTAV